MFSKHLISKLPAIDILQHPPTQTKYPKGQVEESPPKNPSDLRLQHNGLSNLGLWLQTGQRAQHEGMHNPAKFQDDFHFCNNFKGYVPPKKKRYFSRVVCLSYDISIIFVFLCRIPNSSRHPHC